MSIQPQPIDFAWINNNDTKTNLQELSKTLKKDEHFEVDQTNHTIKIVKAEGFGKLVYFFQENRKNREVKELVKSTIIQLVNALPADLDDAQQTDLRTLFLERMKPLSQKVFDRKALGADEIIDKKRLPQILNPKLADTVKTEANKLDTQRKLQRRIEKTKLGMDLGIKLNPISQGASGSYFARDHKMKIIGVFKPGSEESTSTGTPKLIHRIKNAFGECMGISANSNFWPGSGYVSEKLTTVMADHLDIDVIPRAEITKLTSDQFVRAKDEKAAVEEEGSFQIFSPGTKSADELLKLNSMGPVFGNIRLRFNTWRYKDQITEKISQSDFEKMAVTDGLILNKDRHFENWLVKKEARSDADRSHEIVLIDNQLAFPKVNPSIDNNFYRRQQNKWAVLPQAKQTFSQDLKDRTIPLLRGDNLRGLLDKLQVASQLGTNDGVGTFTQVDVDMGSSQALAFKQRVAVLCYALDQDITIREYAGIKSLDEMIAFVPISILDITDEGALNRYLGLA